MQDTDEEFQNLLSIVRSNTKNYDEEQIENHHMLFKRTEDSESFNVMLLSNSNKVWVEVDLFKGGHIMESKSFESVDAFEEYISSDLSSDLDNL